MLLQNKQNFASGGRSGIWHHEERADVTQTEVQNHIDLLKGATFKKGYNCRS